MKDIIDSHQIVRICPHCGAKTQQNYLNKLIGSYQYTITSKSYPRHTSHHETDRFVIQDITMLRCCACEKYIIFKDETQIYPIEANIESPNDDMPEDIKKDYNEAKNIFNLSIRGSCALLRLALDKLLIHLKINDKTLYNKINTYCERFEPDETIKQALHTIRIVGNESVHPGTFNIEDNEDIALLLFEILNDITYDTITKKKKRTEMFKRLPKNKTKNINDSDGI